MSATIETDEQRAARLEAEQEALDRGEGFDGDGRDLPEGAADDGDTTGPAPEGSTVDGQDGLFDHELTDDALEKVLDELEELRVVKADAVADYKAKRKVAMGKIDAFDLQDGEVARCGRHRISVKRVPARSVSFDTAPTRRVDIKLFDA